MDGGGSGTLWCAIQYSTSCGNYYSTIPQRSAVQYCTASCNIVFDATVPKSKVKVLRWGHGCIRIRIRVLAAMLAIRHSTLRRRRPGIAATEKRTCTKFSCDPGHVLEVDGQ